MPQPSDLPNRLDLAIAKCVTVLETEEPHSDNYAKAANQLAGLYKLNEFDKPEPPKDPEPTFSQRVDPNTVILAATNIAGILLVLGYEHSNVIASKAFGMIRPAR